LRWKCRQARRFVFPDAASSTWLTGQIVALRGDLARVKLWLSMTRLATG